MLLTLALPAWGKVEGLEVLLFLATECPISNRYMPEIRRIHEAYVGRGLKFRIVLPEPGLSAAQATDWAQNYGPELPWELDGAQREVKRAGATMTPEAAVFQAGRLVYRGRIDDRYVSWGKASPQPAQRDLCAVLDECLAGRKPLLRTTKSWGCYIESRRAK
jgi:hypothetical protein